MATTTPGVNLYRPTMINFISGLVFSIALIIVILVGNPQVLNHPTYRVLFLITVTLQIFIISYQYFRLTGFYFAVHPHGFEWWRGGSSVKVAWDNMAKLEIVGDSDGHVVGIRLWESVKPKTHGFIAKTFYSANCSLLPISDLVTVPTIGLFRKQINIKKFLQTDFGADLYHYAPHLFEDATSKGIGRGKAIRNGLR